MNATSHEETAGCEYLCECCQEWTAHSYIGDGSDLEDWEDALGCPYCETPLGQNPQRRP